MLTNYFKIAWRNLIKSKLFSFITIFGLSIGFAGTLLISLYISDELSYDDFHENGDQVYRILREFNLPDLKTTFQYTPSALAPSVQQSLPGVEKAVRVQSYNETVSANQKSFIESSILSADEGFFKIFDYRVVEGQPELGRPDAMVISETMAKKYFGDESPIGNRLSVGNTELEVTAVIQDVPENSHLQFHFVTPIRQQQTSWGRNNYVTYVLLNKGEDSEAVTAQIAELINTNTGQHKGAANHSFIPHLQPLDGIHFGKGVDVEIAGQGNISYLYLFIALAIFILTLACVNFINLSTARSAEKSREVGIRKTLGGQRKQIIFQFLGETVFLTTLAAFIAIGIAHFSLPVLSSIAGKSIRFDINNNWYLWCAFICFVPIVGVIAGFYPSLIMSRFQASKAVKITATGSDSKWFRNGLVVFQFAVSISILISTGIVIKQLNYMKSAGLGYNPEQVLLIEQVQFLDNNVSILKEKLKGVEGVQDVTSAFSMPGTFFINSMWQIQHQPDESYNLDYTFADFDYLTTLEINLVAGRDFSSEYANDSSSVILNEAAVSRFGWSPEEAIDQVIHQGGRFHTIIGVVENFHFESLHSEIYPVALFGPLRSPRHLAIRTSTDDLAETIAGIGSLWEEFSVLPFEYTSLSDFLFNQYRVEDRLSKVFGIFSVLAILLACIGLFGSTAYMISIRTKEIGIRKILGAKISQIVIMLNKQLTYLIVIACFISAPISWLIMQNWLADFPYRITPGADVFLISIVIACMLAAFTVSYHSLKASLTKPVENLKND